MEVKLPTTKIKSIMVYVPESFHRQFKQAVVGSGKSIKEVIIEFCQNYINGSKDNAEKENRKSAR
jgi:hypothetical protein